MSQIADVNPDVTQACERMLRHARVCPEVTYVGICYQMNVWIDRDRRRHAVKEAGLTIVQTALTTELTSEKDRVARQTGIELIGQICPVEEVGSIRILIVR